MSTAQIVFRALVAYFIFLFAAANGVIWFACLFDAHARSAITAGQHVLGFICLVGLITYIGKTSNLDAFRLMVGKPRKYRRVTNR